MIPSLHKAALDAYAKRHDAIIIETYQTPGSGEGGLLEWRRRHGPYSRALVEIAGQRVRLFYDESRKFARKGGLAAARGWRRNQRNHRRISTLRE